MNAVQVSASRMSGLMIPPSIASLGCNATTAVARVRAHSGRKSSEAISHMKPTIAR